MRLSLRSTLLTPLLVVSLAASVQAQTVFVDQSQVMSNRFVGSRVRVGQTFSPQWPNIAGAGAYLWNPMSYFQSAVMTVELWDGVALTPGANLIASGSTPFTLAPNDVNWIDVFWSPINVVPGQQYFLTFGADDGTNRFGTFWGMHSGHAAAYDDGDLYRLNGSNYTQYAEYIENDLTFKEYYVTTPEPASMMLVGSGLVGVFGAARRRRQAAKAAV